MSTVKVNNILDVAGTALPTNLLPVTASAWVNFNGTGVIAIRDQYNVSSITDNDIGDYDINFTVALDDTNYSAIANASNTGSTIAGHAQPSELNTTDVRVFVRDTSNVAADRSIVAVYVFGGQ